MQPLRNDRWQIPKSRWSSCSTYISQDARLRDEYQDPALIVNEAVKERLLDAGMDQLLAAHFSHLFIRDPLIVYDEDLEEVDLNETKRFDMIQSTNWQTLRFKPPVLSSEGAGWRVEVRTMEVQITDFENAAFSIFVILLTKAILHFDLDLYIPIAKIDDNMEIAHTRDAVVSQKFLFRKRVAPETVPHTNGGNIQDVPLKASNRPVTDEYRLMSINEIVNGVSPSRDGTPGLIPLIHEYLDTCDYDSTTRNRLDEYLNFIRERANGTLPTTAKWLRSFVQKHPEYDSNSVVGSGVFYDLVKLLEEMSETDFGNGFREKLLSARDHAADGARG